MAKGNHTRIQEVWLAGLPSSEQSKILLFFILLTAYIIILIGNCLVIYLVLTRSILHHPMYIFLSSLAFSEIVFTTNLLPILLHALLNGGAAMNFTNCLAQYYLCASLGVAECFLLAVMSFDRYMAICNPLHYALVMNLKLCLELILCSWVGGFICMLATIVLICQLHFCGPKFIDHFFCDFAPLLELSCSDTSVVKMETTLCAFSVTIFPLGFVIGTYVCIILAILRIRTSTGRKKTFSTCSSHLFVVSTYYGSLIILYVVPLKGLTSTNHKILSLIYTVVTPLFNPIVYSLRNQDIKVGLKKLLSDIIH
ncbi:hypothetical protein GDO86_001809 [Hymenochirus boettgeri]|uniref:Olfactory receptor n=1 Tax=Hymenochirus boettgeri TaxID=247094 RepID=A0A8T2KK67_9PIPI|nr:hypothetical protein GDO86_001809 [Hymenochirus boettgeri]